MPFDVVRGQLASSSERNTIVLPRNFVQLILQMLIVLPLDIENSLVGTA